ncbi:MAG: hypothetical protein AAGK04_02895 [Planctomycetota bacterium]
MRVCLGVWLAAALGACASEPGEARDTSFDRDEGAAVFGPAPAFSQSIDEAELMEAQFGDAEPLNAAAADEADLVALREQALRDMGISVATAPSDRGAPAPRASRTVPTEPTGSAAPDERWTIAIATFGGVNGRAMAEEGLRRVRGRAGLTRAFVKRKSSSWVVAYGSFEDPTGERAQSALERVRTLEVDGGTPFAQAVLMPPDIAASRGEAAGLDLRRAKARYGAEALYTLQVGAYGLIEGVPSERQRSEIRSSAEAAAAELRREGELAFFYHAPNRSMVTVGVFTGEDHDPETGLDSARLRSLRERYPHNLFNGAGIRESAKTRAGGKASRLQPSVLVAIPER